MRRYRLRLLTPGDPLVRRRGHTPYITAGPEQGSLAMVLPVGAVVWYERYGTALKDAIAVTSVARSFDLQLEHPIMLAMGEKGWVDKLGEGMGYMLHGALRGDPGYENMRAAIHAYPHTPLVDERGCTLHVSAMQTYPSDLPAGGSYNPEMWVDALFGNASKVYGLHGEPLASDQIRRALTHHEALGPMMRRFYETKSEETNPASGGGVRTDRGGV